MDIEATVENYFETTLSGSINASSTTIPLTTISGLTSPCYFIIDPDSATNREVILADGTWSGNNVVLTSTARRGLAGSVSGAQSHSAGITVVVAPLAQHVEDLHDRIDADATAAASTYAADADVLKKDGSVALTGTWNAADQTITAPRFSDYSETTQVHGNTGTTETFDCTNGNVHTATLNDNCTFTFSNPPASGNTGTLTLILTQDGTGSRLVTWPSSVDWPSNGTAPTLSTGAADVDVFSFLTTDGGTTWLGFVGGLDFA